MRVKTINSNKFLITLISLKSNINIHFIIFSIIFWVCVLIIAPFQETGFLDDFAYAQSVRRSIFDSELVVSEWSDPSLVFQVIGGGLFSKIFGFSFKTLHLFTLTLFWVGLSGFFLSLRTLKFSNFKALLFTLFLLSTPWFFFFGFSFSTDIPFASLQMISVYFFIRGMLRNSKLNLLISSIVISQSFLVRQIGLAIFLSGLITLIIYRLRDKKLLLNEITTFCVAPVVVFSLYFLWLEKGNYTVNQLLFRERLLSELLPALFFLDIKNTVNSYNLLFHRFVFYISELLGFLVLFFAVFKFNLNMRAILSRRIFYKFFIIILFIFLVFLMDILFNRTRFGLYVPGVPIRYLKFEQLFPIPWPYLWKFMVIIGIMIFSYLLSTRLNKDLLKKIFTLSGSVVVFLGLLLLIQLIMITMAKEMYAEYAIPTIPIMVLLLALVTNRIKISKIFSLIIVIFLIIDMVQMVKLNYQLNGLKWAAGLKLVQEGIDPTQIDIRNYAWPRWFVYEKWIDSEINKAGGKNNVKSAYYDWNAPIKYVIFSDFDSVKDRGTTVKKIDRRILFIRTNVYVAKITSTP